MKIIIGLGNIGTEYDLTRHNVGFMVLDHMAAGQGVRFRTRHDLYAACAKLVVGGEDVWLMKPRTLMNRSGMAVAAGLSKFDPPDGMDDLLVIYDDVALPLGKVRMRDRGSAGGHRGMESILAALGGDGFARLRVGIRGEHPWRDLVDYVLQRFEPAELNILDRMMPALEEAVLRFVREGTDPVANAINGKDFSDTGREPGTSEEGTGL